MHPRREPLLVSVPWQRRLLHLGLHAALLLIEVGAIVALAVALIVADVMSPEVAWKLAIGFASWVATITSAFSLLASRFPKGPLFIVIIHALALPGSVALFLVLNAKLVLRLLGQA